jgi:hypothetical protein
MLADAEALAAAFAGARVSEAFGEITIDIEPADVPRPRAPPATTS